LTHRVRPQTHLRGNLVVALAIQARQNNARSLGHAHLAAATSRQAFKLAHDLCRTRQRDRHPSHEATFQEAKMSS
jgi:hypothetical protein